MRNTFIALLTTLFVSVMTAVPSYGQTGLPSAGCVTVEEVASPKTLQRLAEQGGYYHDIQGPQAEQVQDGLEQLFGSKAPQKFTRVLVANPDGDPDGVLNVIAFGDGGCLIGVVEVPVKMFLIIGEFPHAPLPVPATPASNGKL